MKKILVVDDSGVQRKMIIQIVQKAGFANETLEAEDGSKAIEILAANFEDTALVLCDWNMPNMSGLEFIEAIAQVPAVAGIPVVMVTTEGTEDKIAEAKAANPNLAGYIAKPFTPDVLKATITPILEAAG
ncbi:MAG: response regulator [Candidatus Omnitrophica bacterium]|nr:response regulator [Candidatus Omnitrophota bacterium]